MIAKNERVYFEINEDTCIIEDNFLKINVPFEQQSMDGVDFYFDKDFVADKNFLVKSVTISPAPLMCFWNWLMDKIGCPEYQCNSHTGDVIDISIYQNSGIPGAFGFSGYSPDGSDIVVTFELSD